MGAVLGQPGAPGGHPSGPGCPALHEQCPAQLVQPPGREVDPDSAGGGLRGHMVIGGQPQLDADPLGRVQPAQRGQPPVSPARPQLEFPQRELEQDGRDHRHEAERLRGGRAPRGVREVEARGGGDQAPHGQAGRQAGFGSRGPAGQQHRAHPGRPVQGQEQQVRPCAAQALLSRANPVRPWALIPVATLANPPSSAYWAAEAAASRPRAPLVIGCPQKRSARREGHGRGRGALPGSRRRAGGYPVTGSARRGTGQAPPCWAG